MSTVQGSFLDINPAGLNLLGYEKEDLETLRVQDLYVHLSDRDVLVERLSNAGEVSDYEVLLKRKDGEAHLHCI